jgi:hypothetical protein
MTIDLIIDIITLGVQIATTIFLVKIIKDMQL